MFTLRRRCALKRSGSWSSRARAGRFGPWSPVSSSARKPKDRPRPDRAMPVEQPRTQRRSPTSASRPPQQPASPRPILDAADIAQLRNLSGGASMKQLLKAPPRSPRRRQLARIDQQRAGLVLYGAVAGAGRVSPRGNPPAPHNKSRNAASISVNRNSNPRSSARRGITLGPPAAPARTPSRI